MNKNIQNLETIITNLPKGVTPKVTVLKTRKARKNELICERVGKSSQVRTKVSAAVR